jgi:hypothetical protein
VFLVVVGDFSVASSFVVCVLQMFLSYLLLTRSFLLSMHLALCFHLHVIFVFHPWRCFFLPCIHPFMALAIVDSLSIIFKI